MGKAGKCGTIGAHVHVHLPWPKEKGGGKRCPEIQQINETTPYPVAISFFTGSEGEQCRELLAAHGKVRVSGLNKGGNDGIFTKCIHLRKCTDCHITRYGEHSRARTRAFVFEG